MDDEITETVLELARRRLADIDTRRVFTLEPRPPELLDDDDDEAA